MFRSSYYMFRSCLCSFNRHRAVTCNVLALDVAVKPDDDTSAEHFAGVKASRGPGHGLACSLTRSGAQSNTELDGNRVQPIHPPPPFTRELGGQSCSFWRRPKTRPSQVDIRHRTRGRGKTLRRACTPSLASHFSSDIALGITRRARFSITREPGPSRLHQRSEPNACPCQLGDRGKSVVI